MKIKMILLLTAAFIFLCGFTQKTESPKAIYTDTGVVVLDGRLETLGLTRQERYELRAIAESEALNQGIKGMALIMRVVLNRLEHVDYGDDIHSIIFATGQFWTYGMPQSYESLSKESELALMWVINGWDESEGALYFCADGWNGPEHLFKYGDHWFSKK
jgi:hypothetical protein